MLNPEARAAMTISCRDSDGVPKVAQAGAVIDEAGVRVQVMHNGLRVVAGAYNGAWMTEVIRGLRGHHEPQEELLFHHLLGHVREDSTIVELGAFWAYYSNWYLRAVPRARAVCIEPDQNNLEIGRTNTRINGNAAAFVNACVGGAYRPVQEMARESDGMRISVPCLDMNAVASLTDCDCIELLHLDVQGAEYDFLTSMHSAVAARKLRFIVVSTHHDSISGSRTTHADCLDEITKMGGVILAEHSVEESFSGDGLVVASFCATDRDIRLPPISRNSAAASLFGACNPGC